MLHVANQYRIRKIQFFNNNNLFDFSFNQVEKKIVCIVAD